MTSKDWLRSHWNGNWLLAEIGVSYDDAQPRLESEGASTLVLVSLAAMTGAWLVFLLPYGALSRLISGSAGANDFLEIATAAFASIWVALVVWANR
jgi:preprotein translocase subunit SecG